MFPRPIVAGWRFKGAMRVAGGLLVLLVAQICFAASTVAPLPVISWAPRVIQTGSPCLFRLELRVPAVAVSGSWQGREVTFVPAADRSVWYALAGVDVAAKPGNYRLAVQSTVAGGAVVRRERAITVVRARYKTERLRVPERFVEPDPDTRVRIQADEQLKHAIFSQETEPPEWSGKFRVPIASSVSEPFGTRRTFNGKLASIHRGIDFHALPGTPVLAANSGEVVLARELFYEGNCVIIDHGLGFMTIYMHLSKFEVSEGQNVERGQEIGLTGATGRVTGPHLHIAVRWKGAYLDPAQPWALPVPDLRGAAFSRASTADRKR